MCIRDSHDGEKHTATLVPKMDDELGYYRIGISGGGNTKANAWTSVQYGVYEVKFWVCTTFESLKPVSYTHLLQDHLQKRLEDLMSAFLLVVCVMRLKSGDIARLT